jgi:dolichol-phosphate mannosyltransferase
VDNFRQFISVVIATLNEEQGIGPTLQEMQGVLHDSRFIVVDGNSVDKTIEIAKNMGADVLLQEGKGKGLAMSQGFRMYKSDYVVFTDADYTYPAEYVPKMIQILEQDRKVGMVIGNRFKSVGVDRSFRNPFYVGNKLLAFAQLVMNGVKLSDPLSGLRVVRS